MTNEIGTAAPRGRSVVPKDDAERELSALAEKSIDLPADAVVHRGPDTCPACGSHDVMWGCDPDQTLDREEIHSIVWHETGLMADSFICRTCWAGWIEPDDPELIAWVRPYWRDR